MATTPRVLLDRYEVGRLLGAGGMAEVFEGRDRLLARRVAIKVLQAQFARDPSFLIRFKREAQAAASLSHPNIVGVYDTGTEDGTHFIVMEFVDGRTLKEVIRAEGPLYPERAAEICADVCSALAAAHARGLIHRDIKPGNVMLTPEGKVKVMDFGIARATTSETITQTAAVVGTAQYISPEQAQGQAVDYRSDLYSLGCCLYEMLTGTVPFTGATPVAIAYRHVREDPTPPRMLNGDVPAPLEAICLKAMAKNPDNRYQTATELHDDLERFRNGQPVLATPLLDAAATTQAIPRGDGGADPTAMLSGVPADRATRYAEPYEEERRTSVGWIVVSLLALVGVGLAAFFITRALTRTDGTTATTVTVATTAPPTSIPTTRPPTTEAPTTRPPTTEPPTTRPPTTRPPTTRPPTTEPPTTEPPTTEPSSETTS
jgi:eukaryotic-like serine/threonine-protein kinase